MKMQIITAIAVFVALFSIEQASAAINTDDVAKAMHKKLSSLLAPKYVKVSGPRGAPGGSGKKRFGFKSMPRTVKVTPKLDFVILLDSSGSVKAKGFEAAKEGSMYIIDYIHGESPIGSSGSRAACIEYSSPSKTHYEFHLGALNTVTSVKAAIKKVKFDNGPSTATGPALIMAKHEIENNGKHGNVKVVWVLTDGKSNKGIKPKIPADQLRAEGYTVCAVGIGDHVNWTELGEIADKDCLFKTESFQQYRAAARKAVALSKGNPSLSSNFFKGLKIRI